MVSINQLVNFIAIKLCQGLCAFSTLHQDIGQENTRWFMVSACVLHTFMNILHSHTCAHGKHEHLGSKNTQIHIHCTKHTTVLQHAHRCTCTQTFRKDESQQGVDHVRAHRGWAQRELFSVHWACWWHMQLHRAHETQPAMIEDFI